MRVNNVFKFLIMLSFLNAFTSCSLIYKKVTITGKALNDKDGAILETENKDYLIDKCDEWDEEFYNKNVIVTGYLVIKTYKKRSSKEVLVQERVGKVYILKRAKWKLKE